MKLKIAVVQLEIKQYAPIENLRKIEHYISEASKADANIIVFPEDCVTGPLIGQTEFADSDKKYLKFFQKLARRYMINIVPGSFIEKDRYGLHNTTYYIQYDGEVKTSYRKINLWHPEKKELNPGNRLSVIETEYGKIGLCICSDLMYPEMVRAIVRLGAEIIICPSYWTYEDAGIGIKYDKNSDVRFINAMCVSRAYENEAIIVYCGAGGKLKFPDWEENLIGRSQITVPFKGALKRLDHNNEEMFIQEIDTKIIEDATKVYGIREDLRTRILN